MGGIYDEPEFYAIACAYRDVRGDVAALLRWWERHRGDGYPAAPRSVLELAAGPAEHARLLASRGLSATTLDVNPVMCAWARDRAAEAGVELTVTEADMRDFTLGSQFDLAITMLNSLCHLTALDDMVAHLMSLARHVAPGGLYIAELAHPADWLTPHPRTSSEWVTEVDGGSATVRWGGPGDLIDPVTQVVREHVAVTYRTADGSARTVTDVVPNRFWTATELDAAIRLAGGFETVARYGDFDEDLALDAPGAWRLILVLRRTAAAPRGRIAAAPLGRTAAGDGD
ncbi:MAG TPA: class I SAM-dependent methyltransferase [Streptosporangiaceae bacterium]|nr:class I SAM-dependent methyltransferase [Streptosporangiaceae bacterium]